MRRVASLGLALALAAVPAASQTPKGPSAPGSSSASASSAPAPQVAQAASAPGWTTSLAAMAQAIAKDLARVPAGALVVAAPVQSDQEAPHARELAVRVASLVAGAIGHGATWSAEPLPLERARVVAERASALVHVATSIAGGRVSVVADLVPVSRNTWDRVRSPVPAPTAHAFAWAPIDAEAHTFLVRVELLAHHVDKATTDDRDVLALACGDVDGDGAPELVTVSRTRIAIGRLRGGKLVASRVTTWAALSPLAATPSREPIATARIVDGDEARYVEVAVSDRARRLRLDAELRPTRRGEQPPELRGYPLGSGVVGACLAFAPTGGALLACDAFDHEVPMGALANARFDLAQLGHVVDASAHADQVVALRDPGTGDLRVRIGDTLATLPGVGAQLAIADLDGGGDAEIVASADVPNAVDDVITIVSVDRAGGTRERARIPVPGGVRAIAACPFDGPGAAPLAIATATSEIWIVR